MMLEGLLEYMQGTPGVRFERTCDYVERWRRENPRESTVAGRRGSAEQPSR